MYTSVLHSLAKHVHAGFSLIISVKCLQNQTQVFQTNLFKCEEIKSGFIRQAKHQRSLNGFMNKVQRTVQRMCWELGSQALKSVEHW